ncbi:DEAD/DEAH box helicase [Acetobacter orleanensis]|uniref:DEAD/DEAH box helicase n=1 Tax=Acetobacter orleanensis TaxID=104099 RepID=A0A4Y3TPS7_9PROT|nr:DEAD/DEAH box helicase [Acetobacter orleanensis]KXV62723.1 DEAD/DEAH box helicase [Acetobacter orleanensis]PCD79242.1 ATP-dependent helicase [Acetobacter orleanensis]GAN67853.1 DNA/RNA helicase [Acetobacter orleanensis JCM 7639]GBR23729.1 DNA/RNA helicase [Acetobacter orleanensis NRIC 0473]GEB83469.1 DEAD/DEAH box helicase [Acetobacter orleanensis]
MPFQNAPASLASALAARGYESATPVQAAVLAPDAEGRDLLVSARTGSGKTVAFGLAMANTLLDDNGRCPAPGAPLALVIAPTRELALQVRNELEWLYASSGARIVSCVGGMEPRVEARALNAGCHIVVGTPGRLCDHLSRGQLKLSSLRAVVLDEADEMLDLGFRDELETLLKAAPPERRTLLFSATIARDIANLARRYQTDALRIDTQTGSAPHTDITYRAILTDQSDMANTIVNVLRQMESPTAIVFCHTREAVRQLQGILTQRGFSSVAISGDLGQNERSRAIESLRHGQARVCVATDVAARGIDIPDLGLVIHASLPSNPATLLHRSGRTGRAGRKGTCVLLVPPSRRRLAERLLEGAKVTAEWGGAPTPDDIAKADAERLLSAPELSITVPEAGSMHELITKLTAAHSADQLAAALIAMWRANLPEPTSVRVISPGSVKKAPRERTRRDDEDGESRGPREPGTWFRLSVGREDRADPKWLVPMLCRLGGIRKQDIGAIRIQPDHTLVEIAQDKAERFQSCAAGADADEITVEPSAPPRGGASRDSGRPPRSAGGPGGAGRPPRKSGGGGFSKSGPSSSRKRKSF